MILDRLVVPHRNRFRVRGHGLGDGDGGPTWSWRHQSRRGVDFGGSNWKKKAEGIGDYPDDG